MKKSLRNKTVLITGASGGIGAATAKEFAQTGAEVLLVARNESKLRKVVDEIIAAGGKQNIFLQMFPILRWFRNWPKKLRLKWGFLISLSIMPDRESGNLWMKHETDKDGDADIGAMTVDF